MELRRLFSRVLDIPASLSHAFRDPRRDLPAYAPSRRKQEKVPRCLVPFRLIEVTEFGFRMRTPRDKTCLIPFGAVIGLLEDLAKDDSLRKYYSMSKDENEAAHHQISASLRIVDAISGKFD